MLYAGEDVETFCVAQYEGYSLGNIFLERTAVPSFVKGYGDIRGVFSIGGIKTYKINSPRYAPEENALLEFDVYFDVDDTLTVCVEAGEGQENFERYTYETEITGGGKWKRIILKAEEFKSDITGKSLKSFVSGNCIIFDCGQEETKFAVTNMLWL